MMRLCNPESNEQFEKIVQYVDAHARKYLVQNNKYLSDLVDKLFKYIEIAKAENRKNYTPDATAETHIK